MKKLQSCDDCTGGIAVMMSSKFRWNPAKVLKFTLGEQLW